MASWLSQIVNLLSFFNWIDWLTVVILTYFFLDGTRVGFVRLFATFLSYLISIFAAIKLHGYLSGFLGNTFGVGESWAQIISYFLIFLVIQIISALVLTVLFHKLLRKVIGTNIDSVLGAVVSFVNTVIIMTFIFIMLLSLPLRGTIRTDIRRSFIARTLVTYGEKYGGPVKSILDEMTAYAVRFMTVHPSSRESVNLDIRVLPQEMSADVETEHQMVNRINEERAKVGVVHLIYDQKLTEIGRDYSRKMLSEGFFSHFDKEGRDVSWRVEKAGVNYARVGENLAYAPDLETAHKGLMESEGHRKNILDSVFSRVGVGIIDAGIYGKMFTQIFADDLSYFQNK